jgi:hypothetical protein
MPIEGRPISNGGPITERTSSSVGIGNPSCSHAHCSDRTMPGSLSDNVPSRSRRTWVRTPATVVTR